VAEEVREALPSGWSLHVLETEADGSGDGVGTLGAELREAIRDAEIYLGFGAPSALLHEAEALKWIHSGAAGVGAALSREMLESPVLFTNSKGIHGPPMGDTALAMILHFARGLDFAVSGKSEGRWNTGPFYASTHPLVELAESTVGVFGFGGVGREVAHRILALGGSVLAFDRGIEPPQGREGDQSAEPALGLLFGEDGFHRLLQESDFLVLTAPETDETRGKLDGEALARMKPSAVLVNLSRGRLVEEDALVEALESGRLRGAGLDVYWEEPLPPGHRLWQLPNVLLTPHVSAVTRGYWRRQVNLIRENLDRYFRGEPLLNLVDKEAGF
jgi:phosphoglycerate dehydrogenase-like enzyme